MNFENFDGSRCARPEKQIVEGLCLSFDLLRQVCLETGEMCLALGGQQAPPDESSIPTRDHPA